jgi:4-hydroxy-tetrahydrodipicolinate reductase
MSDQPLRVLLVGYGRMGRLVEQLAEADPDVEIVGRLTSVTSLETQAGTEADVAIDFSTASAVPGNVAVLAARGTSVVIGTTGWQDREREVRATISEFPIGVLVAPNFAIGVNAFFAIAERAAALLATRGFAPYIHEAHHSGKKDAPSGTALMLQSLVLEAGGQPVDVSSTRAGSIPGTHTVGFDAVAETVTLTHAARDRTAFARGALEAAKWIKGRHGWFTMRDMLGL